MSGASIQAARVLDKHWTDAIAPAEQQQPTLPHLFQDAFGARLPMYETIKAEAVPDRLSTLLQQIEQQSSKE